MIMCEYQKNCPTRGYTLQKSAKDDMIKIAPTIEIYNRSMVQKHPVLENNLFQYPILYSGVEWMINGLKDTYFSLF